jgi:hypothetical protein
MLSHHEISTLLLIQRSPSEVEALGLETARLRHERLVEIELLMTGRAFPRLTSKGLEVLQRLNASCKHQCNAGDDRNERGM